MKNPIANLVEIYSYLVLADLKPEPGSVLDKILNDFKIIGMRSQRFISNIY